MDDRQSSLAPPDAFITFGDLLRYLRRRSGFTQRELSIQVGYSEPHISLLEKNRRLPEVSVVQARFIPALDLDFQSPYARRLIHLAEAAHIENKSISEAPYKGLQYFDIQDADLFYGRELLTARLVRHLRIHRFLAIVVGASGSGKSSVVRAGLIPAMQRWQRLVDGTLPPPGSAHWKYIVLTPGSNPLETIVSALEEIKLTAHAMDKAVSAFLADETRLDQKASEILRSRESKHRHLFLVVDQFEEIFTLCKEEKARQAFIDNLMFSASDRSGGIVSVVITLRADFYAHCSQYPNLREGLASHQEYIGPMSPDEIRRAIEQPAAQAGLLIEPGLVDLILKEMGEEPGGLPLLSHALLETWKRRQNQVLTFRGYHQAGGIRGAISQTAENVFLMLDERQQAAARRIFLSLTELGQAPSAGLPTPDSRRRVRFTDLTSGIGDSETADLMKRLADARLIILTEDSAEASHEALIREWPRLRAWLAEDRENLVLHRQLQTAADRWDVDGKRPEDLYRGIRLSQAFELAENFPDDWNALEREFLDASRSLSERETAEREAQQRNELLATQKLLESEFRRTEEQQVASERLRRRARILTFLFIISAILALAALRSSRAWDTAAKLSTSRELAAASVNNLDVDPERSILLALEALSITYTREAEQALHQAVLTSRVETTLRGHVGVVGVAVFSPDGTRIVTAGADGKIMIWDARSGKNTLILEGSEEPVYEIVFSPSGRLIASAGEDGTARIWNSETGALITALKAGREGLVGLVFSPDEKWLAAGSVGGSIFLWDMASGAELYRLQGHEDVVISIAFTPDAGQMITSSFDARLIFWDTETGDPLRTFEGEFDNLALSTDGKLIFANSSEGGKILEALTGEELVRTGGHTNLVFTAAINSDWTRLATAGLDQKVIVSDVEMGKTLFTLSGHTSEVLDVHFSPDGQHLISASADGSARVWYVTSAREVSVLEVDSYGRLAVSPQGNTIAAGDQESVKVWDLQNGDVRFAFEMPAFATGVSFDPINPRLAGASESGDVRVWNLVTGMTDVSFKASDEIIMFLAFSPDGKEIATASRDGAVVWNAMNGEMIQGFPGVETLAVCFSPDGSRLLSAGMDQRAVLWDLQRGESLFGVTHDDIIWGCAFSPDGERFATASRDATARVWSATTGEELLRLAGHTSTVTAVSFSPDGRQLASTSRDGLTKLWDTKSGEQILNLYGSGEGLNGVVFSPDGKYIVSAGSFSIRVYLRQLDDLIALAKTRLTRSLTEEECSQYLHQEYCP